MEEISKLGYFSISVLQENKKQEKKIKSKKNYLLSLVADIYQHNLLTQPGSKVLDYLQSKRQINSKLIECFSLGCSINNRQISTLLFQQKNDNFSSDDLLLTNLVWITDNNRTHDFFFAQQLIIPLKNPEGKIIAFVARKIEETATEEGKYKYLPNYQYYSKSSLLYNYHVVKKSWEEECYLVEGFFDVISLTKLGIENCLAILGTDLSEEQIRLIIELKKRIILFLDGDRAGKEATIKVSVKLLSREIDCEVIKYDYKEDPDEICRQHDRETVLGILQKRENPYLFVLEHYFTKLEIKENPQRNSQFIREIAKTFQKFKPNVHDFLIEKISLLIKWNKEEVEPYFVKRNFPAPNIHYSQIIYCQEIIKEKEKEIIFLCAQEKIFWLLTTKKNYFFSNRNDREIYYNIYNYYASSPHNKSFRNCINSQNAFPKDYSVKLDNEKNETVNSGKRRTINAAFQKIDIVKKFILNYEKNRHP